jgi:hypothetical protein
MRTLEPFLLLLSSVFVPLGVILGRLGTGNAPVPLGSAAWLAAAAIWIGGIALHACAAWARSEARRCRPGVTFVLALVTRPAQAGGHSRRKAVVGGRDPHRLACPPRRHGGDDIAAGAFHRLGQCMAERRVGGDRRRQRAARAVQVGAWSRGRQPQHAISSANRSTTSSPGGWPPLSSTAWPPARAARRPPVRRIDTVDHVADQQRHLVEIGRDDDRAREQFAHQHGHRLGGDQPVAAGGDHDRIEHVGQLVVVDGPGHYLDDLGRMQHAELDGVDADVWYRLDLRLQENRRHAVDADAERVLRRQRGDRGHPVAAESREGLGRPGCRRPRRCRSRRSSTRA